MTRADIGDDEPLRLETAAQIAFPDGTMTVSGLRKERDRGTLVTELIAGKEYTTLADIREMRRLCRERQRGQGSTPGPSGGPPRQGKFSSRPSGSSETDQSSEALASALKIAETLQRKPSKPSESTSAQSTPPRGKGIVVQHPSSSRM